MPEQRTVGDLSTKRQIEADLHAKLEAARHQYDFASEGYQVALKHCDEFRTASPQDGNGKSQLVRPSVTEAVKAQRDAFEEYRRALDTFNKFILYGDLPK